jgi:hypothetical protein
MFPAGTAGLGLLILRLCAAGMLLRPVIPGTSISAPVWAVAGLLLIGFFLCVGLLTPVGCIASGVLQILLLYEHLELDNVQTALSLSITVALLLVGPGAFSIDSRLFGRRLIVRSK